MEIVLILFIATSVCTTAVLSSRYARYRGNRFVKSIFIVVGFVLGIKMLTGV